MLDPVDHLDQEGLGQQRPRLVQRKTALLHVEQGALVQISDRIAVRALHIVGVDLELGLGEELAVLVQQERLADLVRQAIPSRGGPPAKIDPATKTFMALRMAVNDEMGNLNALALESMGHIAGMAASVTGSLSTVVAVVLAAPVGLSFNGTAEPLTIIGFAAETETDRARLLDIGRAKIARKGSDYLVLNTVGWTEGFASETNTVILLSNAGDIVGEASGGKRAVADRILDLLGEAHSPQS